MRHTITKQYCSTNLVLILTSRKLGQLSYFRQHYQSRKSLTVPKFRLHVWIWLYFSLLSFSDMDFKWDTLCPLMATNSRRRGHKHGYTSLGRTFLTACDIFLKHHLSRLRLRAWRSASSFKMNFLLTFKQCRSNNLDLPTAIRNPNKTQPGSLASKKKKQSQEFLLRIYLWNLCSCPDLVSNYIRSSGPTWVIGSLSNPEGKKSSEV